jgi:PPM family protein phosphatase
MDTDQTDPGSRIHALDAFASKAKLCLEPMVKVDFGAVTHVGKVRQNNEDHYLIVRLGRSLDTLMTNIPAGQLPASFVEYGYGMQVADGMGGAAAGEVASRTALSLLVKLVIDAAKWGRQIDEREAEALMERIEGYYMAIQ